MIIPAKVLEELDKLKLKNNIDKNALNTAARNINLAFTKQFSKMEDADISLLPVGFDKNNPDFIGGIKIQRRKSDNTYL